MGDTWTWARSQRTRSRRASSSNCLGGSKLSSSLKLSAMRESFIESLSERQGSPGMGTGSVVQAS
ncbi:hypothetical protein COEX109129_39305 [Corallococcus exiguus]